ncbi:MAG: hypothetical protein ACR2MX_10990 [Cyclobacteriaceae bacterium]
MPAREVKSDVLWKCIALIATVACGYSQLSNKLIRDDIRSLIKDLNEIKQSIAFVKEDHEEIKVLRSRIVSIEKDLHYWKLNKRNGKNSNAISVRRGERDG